MYDEARLGLEWRMAIGHGNASLGVYKTDENDRDKHSAKSNRESVLSGRTPRDCGALPAERHHRRHG